MGVSGGGDSVQLQEGRGRVSGYCSHALSLPPPTPTHPHSCTLSPPPLTPNHPPSHTLSPTPLTPTYPPSPFLYLCTVSLSTPTHPPSPFLYFLYFTLQEGNLEEQIAGTPFNQPYIAVHGTDGLCHEHVFSHRKVGCVQCQLCFPGC